jgi:hypothetical protein
LTFVGTAKKLQQQKENKKIEIKVRESVTNFDQVARHQTGAGISCRF